MFLSVLTISMASFLQHSPTFNIEILQGFSEDSLKFTFPCKSNEKDSDVGRKTNQLSSWGTNLGFCYEVPRKQDQGLSSIDFLLNIFSFLRFLNNPSRVSHCER